jgi:hypothetical protein
MSKNASVSVPRIWIAFLLAIGAFSPGITKSMAAEDCPSAGTDIATDRPDVTNSSVVVPQGSLQTESGVNWTARQGATVIDGPTTRLRLGVAPCTEILLDLPNYFHPLRDPEAASGFSDLGAAIKHQFGSLPGELQLSVTAGLELPTGAVRISGPGYGGYIQLPWSKGLGRWSLSGMFTAFWFPGQPSRNPTLEPTFVVERQVGPRADVFIEYFADSPQHGTTSQAINSGGAYRLTSTQQIDFHAGFGLNRESPDYFFGLGYSFRLDGLF